MKARAAFCQYLLQHQLQYMKNDNHQDISVEVHNLTVTYDSKPVLWDIDFSLPEGQVIGIIGPNGAGKSTLLKAIMELVPGTSGYVQLFGQSLSKVRNRISYVPQRESVDWDFPATVMDVVLMGRYRPGRLFRRLSAEDREVAREALRQVGLSEFHDRQIGQLSGGQQQRVFIARALARGADLYLMDEPFAGVDAASEEAILQLLMTMKAEGKTLIIVHHDLYTARQFFDWVVLLNTRLIKAGPVEEVFTEDNLKATYGSQLTILSRLGHLIGRGSYPIRERGSEQL